MGRSIGGKCFDDEERRFGDALVTGKGRVGVAEGWAGGEDIDWIGRDVGFEFNVAVCRDRLVVDGGAASLVLVSEGTSLWRSTDSFFFACLWLQFPPPFGLCDGPVIPAEWARSAIEIRRPTRAAALKNLASRSGS